METNSITLAVVALLILIALGFFFYFVPVGLWITALFSGVRVGMGTLIGMRLRKVNPADIVRPYISASKAGLDLDVGQMEAHHLAGGNVGRVVAALISADRANIDLPWQRATAIDLAGRDVLEAVQVSVNPKVIQTPRVTAVAKDGIQVIAVARVTVRANIDRLVGGAGEETIIARVGEGTVSSIGSADSHKSVLENPDQISRLVLERGLDAGTAYEILSIDIADVDVGRNIGAELQTDQAEADKRIAQAKAEERRAMAVASEQEMRARVVEAEAEVPLALADAFRTGRLGVMDHYRMENIQADTTMRSSLALNEGYDAGAAEREKATMLQRLRDALRELSDQPPNRQFRPNELRREVVREERLRRETRRVELPVASRPQLSVEEQRARRAQPSPALAMPTREAPVRLSALATRSGLRQAWLLKEILGPPLALRDSQTGGDDR